MARLTREEQQAQTRARVLTAARSVFEEKGYAQASLEEIAVAAGCTRGAIYPQFGGKPGLFQAVLDSLAGSQLSRWESLAAQDLTDEQRIAALGELIAAEAEVVGTLRRAAREYAASGVELNQPSAETEQRDSQFDVAVQEMCARLGGASSLSPHELGVVVKALANGLWVVHDSDPSVDIARLFSASFALMLGAQVPVEASRSSR